MAGILETIAERTRADLAARKVRLPADVLRGRAEAAVSARRPLSLHAALKRPVVNVVAELKRASPSKGRIRMDLDLADVAASYEANGAAAISVLTEENWFLGSLDFLREARARTALPLLRKDFIVDDYQILEAAAAGADAVLLIVALLDDVSLARLGACAASFGMEALVEAHTVEEARRAVALGAVNIGVNSRDLRTFRVFPEKSQEILATIPESCTRVAESGIATPGDIARYPSADAFLVGEALMRGADPGETLRGFVTAERGRG